MREKATTEHSPVVEGNGEIAEGPSSQTPKPMETRSDGAAAMTIYDVIERLWQDRVRVVVITFAFIAAGCIYLLGSRAEYRTGAVLMPEKVSEQGLGSLGVLSQFSGLLGNALPSDLMGPATQIPADLYPEIAQSTAIQLALLNREVSVPSDGAQITLYDYLQTEKPFSMWEWIGGLPARVVAGDASAVPVRTSPVDTSIVYLTRPQLEAVEDLRDRVHSEYDMRQGTVEVSVAMPDPEIAAQVASALVSELTGFVTSYRTERQRRKVEFIGQLHGEAQQRFNTSLESLANFRDTHRNLARDIARSQEQRLQADYDLSFNLYNSLASRLEEARIQLQEQSPVFKTLQPVTVPLRKSYPPILLTLLLCGLLGVLAGSGYSFIEPSVHRIRDIVRRTN